MAEMLERMGAAARAAARALASATAGEKNKALQCMAQSLLERQEEILAANRQDMDAAAESGMAKAMLDRLSLSPSRIAGMADGLRQVAALADPVGEIVQGGLRPNGLRIEKTRVPLGVVGIIYEARPNVTSDAAALCLKAGNAVILRGGKEALRSNAAVADALRDGLASAGLNPDAVQLIRDTSRETANAMMRLHGVIDVLIPRGGAHPRGGRKRDRPRDRNRGGQLPHLHRPGRGHRDGRPHHRQRQGIPPLGLQRGGNPAGA